MASAHKLHKGTVSVSRAPSRRGSHSQRRRGQLRHFLFASRRLSHRGRGPRVSETSYAERIRRGRPNGGKGLSNRCRSEEHTSELQSRGLISYAVFCLKKK